MKTPLLLALSVIIIALASAILFWPTPGSSLEVVGDGEGSSSVGLESSANPVDEPSPSPPAGQSEVGESSSTAVQDNDPVGPVPGGIAQPISNVNTPAVQSVVNATGGRHPERLTASITPKAFDSKAYAANPAAYLNVVEPGRVWQSLQPAVSVPAIYEVGQAYHEVLHGQSVELVVKTLPGMPATFTSFDMGAFGNQLTSQTVAADEDGNAKVQFTATPGTTGDVRILAASPVTSGQVHFMVEIVIPGLGE